MIALFPLESQLVREGVRFLFGGQESLGLNASVAQVSVNWGFCCVEINTGLGNCFVVLPIA